MIDIIKKFLIFYLNNHSIYFLNYAHWILKNSGCSHQKNDKVHTNKFAFTRKSLSEALILVSTNPQYDKRLFIELRVQYMKIPSSEHVENMLCTQIVFCFCFDISLSITNRLIYLKMHCKNDDLMILCISQKTPKAFLLDESTLM